MCTKPLSDAIYHTVRLNKQAGRKPSTKYVLISFFFFFFLKRGNGGFVFTILQYPIAGTRKREFTVVRSVLKGKSMLKVYTDILKQHNTRKIQLIGEST